MVWVPDHVGPPSEGALGVVEEEHAHPHGVGEDEAEARRQRPQGRGAAVIVHGGTGRELLRIALLVGGQRGEGNDQG